ncbi:Short C-terminal domain-containing protein [Pedobacter westerhofensis]|uniref:Short C-terminal domain-containing protein n=1 Tax=Pedobacter westerhofensis TaxID=425512 RepID=A0A521DIN5_9SPHI|nr:PH domain-containing protein [Pedobacter westerhofensis]SMO70991.1 Short C-terminal domain-containing protein [Pedobacter westerhofensis]
MILIDRFLSDEQDPKAVEKVLGKLNDMLTTNEELIYLAVQKKPAVNLLPDCIAVSNKRIFYCEPANFGITMNFKDISWKTIKEVSFKEELFGSKFICVPQHGENIITEYIPKVQARKLYQAAYEQLESFREQQQLAEQADRRAQQQGTVSNLQAGTEDIPFIDITPSDSPAKDAVSFVTEIPSVAAVPPAPIEEPEDETTLKLRKLKTLYDKQLITQEEYEAKKADILDSF